MVDKSMVGQGFRVQQGLVGSSLAGVHATYTCTQTWLGLGHMTVSTTPNKPLMEVSHPNIAKHTLDQ